jgi:CyaY protein
MTQTNFALHAMQTLEDILDRMSRDDALSDLDFDLIDGVLTIEFDDGGKVIINRQEAAQQLWLASPEGPAHFNYDAQQGEWCNDRNGETLLDTLSRVLSEQTDESIEL